MLSQTYDNYKIFISVDDDYSFEYVRDTIGELSTVPLEPDDFIYKTVIQEVKKGNGVFWNDYMNTLLKQVNQGWIIYLDDDVTMKPNALKTIAPYCDDVRRVIVWKYKFASGRIIPEREFWKKQPTRKHWDSGCFCHSFRQRVFWPSQRAADWRVGTQLWGRKLKFSWIDKVLFVAGNNGDVGKKTDIVL